MVNLQKCQNCGDEFSAEDIQEVCQKCYQLLMEAWAEEEAKRQWMQDEYDNYLRHLEDE
jgi:hypothetical protein